MCPIVGKRYKCKNCYEKPIVSERDIGFDLCEECYNTPSQHSDLVNHHHMQGHTLELVAEDGDSPVPEVLKRIDREETFQLDRNAATEIVCDHCEMNPIVGKHYRCIDCWEKCMVTMAGLGIWFDLSEKICNTPAKPSDFVKYHHT